MFYHLLHTSYIGICAVFFEFSSSKINNTLNISNQFFNYFLGKLLNPLLMGVSVNPSTYPMTLSHQISKKTDPYFS